ncbi:WbuC family cupin fold metalloprotein [Shewanella surugensis]|uniref:WbuC family cupin fold metalloprotein n=1 Tax=Shewanella surugensis TaxID=212020 RepID=A0ABT0LGU7_9GAMM|nr:WbuC family cupin fold metalloprotein [Shewanella surugensis]MCL1126922.1 WbuC family cupin fold metalloprotein [Shewanella surugensis]
MIKVVTQNDFDALRMKAKEVERKRAHLNVHDSLDANVQRLLIATEPETYIRPHRHSESHKWEMFMVLAGEIDLLVFDDNGRLISRIKMSQTATRVVEIPPNTWHTYVVQQSGTLAMEVKEGAYTPTPEADFATWAPAEKTKEAEFFLETLRVLQPEMSES